MRTGWQESDFVVLLGRNFALKLRIDGTGERHSGGTNKNIWRRLVGVNWGSFLCVFVGQF